MRCISHASEGASCLGEPRSAAVYIIASGGCTFLFFFCLGKKVWERKREACSQNWALRVAHFSGRAAAHAPQKPKWPGRLEKFASKFRRRGALNSQHRSR